MRILVYPHAMELGGSQLNAIELAGAVRDRGHDVAVYGVPGPLADLVHQLGLELVSHRHSLLSPGPATAVDLRRLVRERSIDIVHGYEWPPILEGFAATAPPCSGRVVGTVMSMAIAGFIPRSLPLIVGTQRLQSMSASLRPGPVYLMEPPVDVDANRPGTRGGVFRETFNLDKGSLVVMVTRLATELKLEGVLTAVRVVASLARSRPVQLVIVGDGPARAEVADAAQSANRAAGHQVVVLTGELLDPRGAYDAADICIGMGGSALRAMAFGKPLIVQGEGGFFSPLTPDTSGIFLRQGWYGIGSNDRHQAAAVLSGQLTQLLDDPRLAVRLGAYGRELVENRFSLGRAACELEKIYSSALTGGVDQAPWVADAAISGAGLVRHKVARRWQRVRGRAGRDDFNARPA